jgi:hypothetical protein
MGDLATVIPVLKYVEFWREESIPGGESGRHDGRDHNLKSIAFDPFRLPLRLFENILPRHKEVDHNIFERHQKSQNQPD